MPDHTLDTPISTMNIRAMWQRRDFALATLCLAVYLLTGAGFVYHVDGALVYALTKNLVEHHSISAPSGFGTITGQNGGQYSPYNLGQSLVAVPFYLVGKALTPFTPRVASFTAADFVVSTFNAFVTAATVWLIVRLVVELGYPLRAALLTGAAYGFGSMAWLYSRTFFTEPLTALCLLLSVLLLVRSRRGMPAWPWMLAAGLAAGGALFTRVTAAVFAPGLLLYALLVHRRARWRGLPLVGAFAAGYAVFLGATLWYNYARFANPVETGYTALNPYLASNLVDRSQYDPGAVLYAIYGMLLSPGKGVFLYAPVLCAALAGLVWFARYHRLEAILIGLLSGALLLLHAAPSCKTCTLDYWFGGWSWGPRYLLAILPVATLPAAAWFAHMASVRYGRLVVGVALAAMVLMQVPSVAVSELRYYIRVVATEQQRYEKQRLLVDSWRDSQYVGQWREALSVTQRVLDGRPAPQSRLSELQDLSQMLEHAEALNTYQFWWFRLVGGGRLHGMAQVSVLALVGSLLLIAWGALLACAGLPLPTDLLRRGAVLRMIRQRPPAPSAGGGQPVAETIPPGGA